ncbi:MAG: bifunctional riboflavin kinase/FAD synthetase [Anaerolineaceae bacterium]|nr:bifunctional riboflavin kinase/FAD synthetase [Anaerolineaceae bacterium]
MTKGYKERKLSLKGTWLTIGSFDGVHLGHQKIINYLVEGAKAANVPSTVITFYPHPAVYLKNITKPYYLTSPEEKDLILSGLGVDSILTVYFNQFISRLSPRDFISTLHRQLKFTCLLVGYDFRMGAGREGDLKRLEYLGTKMGFCVRNIKPLQRQSIPISSSMVRASLKEGDLSTANDMLGYPYSIRGEVVHGDGRGKHIGIPTANLSVWGKKLLPEEGVYAAFAFINGRRFLTVVSIGFRPTFYEMPEKQTIEAHILGFSDQIYGRQIKLQFILRLREEKKFRSVGKLMKQIRKDISDAEEVLTNVTTSTDISS